MRDPRAKVATYNTVPIVLKALFEGCFHHLSDSALVEGGLKSAISFTHCVLGHLWLHVIDFDNGFAESDTALCSVSLHLI